MLPPDSDHVAGGGPIGPSEAAPRAGASESGPGAGPPKFQRTVTQSMAGCCSCLSCAITGPRASWPVRRMRRAVAGACDAMEQVVARAGPEAYSKDFGIVRGQLPDPGQRPPADWRRCRWRRRMMTSSALET